MRRIFGPEREEVSEGWRQLHHEELYKLYASLDIVRVIKLRRMRWVVHMACLGGNDKCAESFGRGPNLKRT
jgi:hypothetical protein